MNFRGAAKKLQEAQAALSCEGITRSRL